MPLLVLLLKSCPLATEERNKALAVYSPMRASLRGTGRARFKTLEVDKTELGLHHAPPPPPGVVAGLHPREGGW